MKLDRIYSVRYTHPDSGSPDDKGEWRLGPYFSLTAARNQASRAHRKGATILGIDTAEVTWEPTDAT